MFFPAGYYVMFVLGMMAGIAVSFGILMYVTREPRRDKDGNIKDG